MAAQKFLQNVAGKIKEVPIGLSSIYLNQNLKTGAKIWCGQVAAVAGVATFFPTDNNLVSGNALFINIYSVQAIAESNTAIPTAVPLASIKLIAADKKTITINIVNGTVLVILGATILMDGTANVHLTIIGD